MAKDKVTVTIDPVVLANADEDAAAAGLNRSEYVERLLIEAHYGRCWPGPSRHRWRRRRRGAAGAVAVAG